MEVFMSFVSINLCHYCGYMIVEMMKFSCLLLYFVFILIMYKFIDTDESNSQLLTVGNGSIFALGGWTFEYKKHSLVLLKILKLVILIFFLHLFCQ